MNDMNLAIFIIMCIIVTIQMMGIIYLYDKYRDQKDEIEELEEMLFYQEETIDELTEELNSDFDDDLRDIIRNN